MRTAPGARLRDSCRRWLRSWQPVGRWAALLLPQRTCSTVWGPQRRWITQLSVLAGRGHVRLATQEELAALREVERQFGLSGLAESVRAAPSGRGGSGGGGAAVACPHHHTGLTALATLWAGAARVHGSDARLQVSVRRQAAAQRGLGGAAAVEVAAADAIAVQQATAFYLYKLASSTAAAFLSRRSGSTAARAP